MIWGNCLLLIFPQETLSMASLLLRRSRTVCVSLFTVLCHHPQPHSFFNKNSSPMIMVNSSSFQKSVLPLFFQFRRSTFHLDVFTSAERNFHYCFTCNTTQVFHNRDDWLLHNTTYHPEKKFSYCCELCHCGFRKPEELNTHLSTFECVLYGPLLPHIEFEFSDLSHARFSAEELISFGKIKNVGCLNYVRFLYLYCIVFHKYANKYAIDECIRSDVTSYYADTIIVYVNSVERAICLEGILKKCNIVGVAHLHHIMSQSQMEDVLLTEFRVLVCTDLLDNVSMTVCEEVMDPIKQLASLASIIYT